MISKTVFEKSIQEIELINNNVSDDNKNCLTYYKVIILFLCTKLEKYVVDSAKEYIIGIKNKGIKSKLLPNGLKELILQNELDKIQKVGIHKYSIGNEYKNGAVNFSLIWDDSFVISYLDEDDFYIELSKHGTNTINDMYKKIGFDALVEKVPNYEIIDIVAGVSTIVSNSVENILNKIVGMRNNIIHQDATPSITKQDIELFIQVSKHFVVWIDKYLDKELAKIHA